MTHTVQEVVTFMLQKSPKPGSVVLLVAVVRLGHLTDQLERRRHQLLKVSQKIPRVLH